MTATQEPRSGVRVLAVVPGGRFVGCAVLDGFGLAPAGFLTWRPGRHAREADRRASIGRLLRRVLLRHHPAALAIGIIDHDSAAAAALRDEAQVVARDAGLPVVARSVAAARQLLLGSQRGRSRGDLAAAVVRGFVPELAGELRIDGEPEQARRARRYRRHAWDAVAVAIHELVLRAPFSAAAVARTEAFDTPTFAAAVTASAQRLHPNP